MELYFKYLAAQSQGFDGDFGAFVQEDLELPHREATLAEMQIVEGNEVVGSSASIFAAWISAVFISAVLRCCLYKCYQAWQSICILEYMVRMSSNIVPCQTCTQH